MASGPRRDGRVWIHLGGTASRLSRAPFRTGNERRNGDADQGGPGTPPGAGPEGRANRHLVSRRAGKGDHGGWERFLDSRIRHYELEYAYRPRAAATRPEGVASERL